VALGRYRRIIHAHHYVGLRGKVMPSTTPKFAFPYPVGTDRVTDGDNAIQALAERVETILGTTRVSVVTKGPVSAGFK